MSTYFTSDLHLGHRNIYKYRDKFTCSKDNDDYMIDQILSLGKRDLLIVVGDFLFNGKHYQEYIERLSKKSCRIKLVMGNHDSLKLYQEPIFEVQLPFFSYKNKWVSHCPIHPQELRGRLGNIHGHLHLSTLEDKRYFNVNIDVNNYEFVPVEVINDYFKGR